MFELYFIEFNSDFLVFEVGELRHVAMLQFPRSDLCPLRHTGIKSNVYRLMITIILILLQFTVYTCSIVYFESSTLMCGYIVL